MNVRNDTTVLNYSLQFVAHPTPRFAQVANISLTLGRTYQWRCDYRAELARFAQELIRANKSIGGQSLRLIGLRDESGSECRNYRGLRVAL